MRSVRRTFLIAPVWLAALMTLATGVPHFRCQCPDGHVKPFCAGPSPVASRGCCGGSCCSSGGACCPAQDDADAGREPAPCCAGHDDPLPGGNPAPDARGTPCQRTPAQAEDRALTHTRTSGSEGPVFAMPLPAQAASAPPPCAATRPLADWSLHSPAPPADLITLLQHLLI